MPLVAAVLVGLGLFAVVAGLVRRSGSDREVLSMLLDAELSEPTKSPSSLAELVAAAGGVTDKVLGRTSFLDTIGLRLTQAGWSVRAGEFVGVVGVSAAAVLVFGWVVLSSILLGIVAAALLVAASMAWIGYAARRRVQKIETQLPDVLQLLASSLESGSSVLNSFELVVEEGDAPLATEFARVVAETRVGRSLVESLEGVADRVGSRDLDWTVEAIRIQHETGGKLADTLRVLADFMRARLEVRGEVRALSAEARISAKILTALPLVIAGFMFMFRRAYFAPLYSTSAGKVMLIVAVSGIVVGSLWMRRLVRVEV